MAQSVRLTCVSSRLAGPAAHVEMLQQLLDAPPEYWKSQTPIPFRPIERAVIDSGRESFGEFVLAGATGVGELETLLVLMAARMPGLSVEFKVDGAADLAGMRLFRGKLEVSRRTPDGEAGWSSIPQHSTLIGNK